VIPEVYLHAGILVVGLILLVLFFMLVRKEAKKIEERNSKK
jgi:preprotein translocase subunit YajC